MGSFFFQLVSVNVLTNVLPLVSHCFLFAFLSNAFVWSADFLCVLFSLHLRSMCAQKSFRFPRFSNSLRLFFFISELKVMKGEGDN